MFRKISPFQRSLSFPVINTYIYLTYKNRLIKFREFPSHTFAKKKKTEQKKAKKREKNDYNH